MGCAFLPSAAGNVFGSLFGGVLFDKVAVDLEMPTFFWAIYVSIGLISIGNFLLYNRWISRKLGIIETKRNFFNSKLSYLGVYSLIGIMILAGISAGTTSYTGDDDRGKSGISEILFESTEIEAFSDEIQEGATSTFTIDIVEPNIRFINCTLTWKDEDDIQRLRAYENSPDTFTLDISMQNFSESASGSNVHGSSGEIIIDLAFDDEPEYFNYTGEYTFDVTLVTAGNYLPRLGPGVIGLTDNGNQFDLTVEYVYLTDQITPGNNTE
jgi:hypothetical protein